jgi:predicted transcriptional regulator
VKAALSGLIPRGVGIDMSTLMIPKELRRRLNRLATRMGLSTTALANLWLEAAVHDEERRLARDQRVTREREAVLVRAILRGEDDRSARTPGVTPR